jgi:hypothetical protein
MERQINGAEAKQRPSRHITDGMRADPFERSDG